MKRELQRLIVLFSLFILFFFQAFPQAPEGYYANTANLSADELKAALHNIIKGHKTYPYTSGSTDVWDILKLTDRDPNNPSNVILFYTGWSVNAAQEYAGGAGWNREHVWAKSHGPFSENTQGPGTDCHHLRPTDISVNSARNNRYFDYADKEYLDGGVPTGCKTSSTRDVWEPRDGQKGDVARMIFYMATRYEGDDNFPDLEVVDYIPAVSADPLHGVLSSLLEWNKLDPVDSFEMNRNNVVYSFQNNRNPFIDHPEFVDLIWAPPVIIENVPPLLANISHSPFLPTSADELEITADASDSDGTVESVKLYWGSSPDNLLNYSEMIFWNGKYTASISAQTAGTEIYFIIEASDNSNGKNTSEISNFSISAVNDISAFKESSGFIYPNPARTNVFVQHQPGEWVTLYSVDGSLVIKTLDHYLDLGKMKKGMYLVRITKENGEVQKLSKLIVE